MNKLTEILPDSLLRTYRGKQKSNIRFEMFEERTFDLYRLKIIICLLALLIFSPVIVGMFGLDLTYYLVSVILLSILSYGLIYYFEKITIGVTNVILTPEERKRVGIKNDLPLYAIYVSKGFIILYLTIPGPEEEYYWCHTYIINEYSEDLAKENKDIIKYVTTDIEMVKNTIGWISNFYKIRNQKISNMKLKRLKKL